MSTSALELTAPPEAAPVDAARSLLAQGLSEALIAKLLHDVEREFDVRIPLQDFLRNPTLDLLGELLQPPAPKATLCVVPAPAAAVAPVAVTDPKALVQSLADELFGTPTDPQADLFQQGVTSLALLKLVQGVKQRLGVEIAIDALLQEPTLRHLCELAAAKAAPVVEAEVCGSCEVCEAPAVPATLGLLSSKAEKEAFLRRAFNIRPDVPGERAVTGTMPDADSFSNDYQQRCAVRDFDHGALPLQQLLGWLSGLGAVAIEGRHRYLYPSAGGTYSVQVYVEAKAGAVEGLAAGMHYFHPRRHALVQLGATLPGSDAHFFYNRPVHAGAGVCLYFVTEQRGIAPVYKTYTEHFAAVETGAMLQLLIERQACFGIGSCILSGPDGTALAPLLQLDAQRQLTLALACGRHARALPQALAAPAQNAWMDIAIVGMDGCFPGAADLDAFWQNLRSGTVSLSGPPRGRWTPTAPTQDAGGYIDGLLTTDAALLGLPQAEAAMLGLQERQLLMCTQRLIEASGLGGENLPGLSRQVGVFAGVMWNEGQADGDGAAPRAPLSVIANRISHHFDWTGPSIAVDTSCSSALTAVLLACASLQRGDCVAAVAGGVNIFSSAAHLENLRRLHLVTDRTRSETFGDQAAGWVPGEGVGAVLLLPLAQARRRGDEVWGVIRGGSLAAAGHVGRFGMPSAEHQVAMMRRCLQVAGVTPDAVQYVEAAAAGSAMGDATEIHAVQQVFGERATPLLVGSVKANVGHLESASGMTQLAKLLLQLRHGEIAPVVPVERLSPLIQVDSGGVRLATSAMPWPQTDQGPRLALVNGLGGTGSYASLLIEGGDAAGPQAEQPPLRVPVVFALSAPSAAQLQAYAALWLRHLARVQAGLEPSADLQRIAASLQLGRRVHGHRLAVLADRVDTLAQTLRAYLDGKQHGSLLLGEGAVHKAVATGSLQRPQALAADWVQGRFDSWAALHGDTLPRKLRLPICPPAVADAAAAESAARSDVRQDETGPARTAARLFLIRALARQLHRPIAVSHSDVSLFELGLSSVGLVALMREVETQVGARVPPQCFFSNPTVDSLSAHLATHHAAAFNSLAPEADASPKEATPFGQRYALSESQLGLWSLQRLTPGLSAYNCPLAFRVPATLDSAVIAAAVAQVVRQHPILQTVIEERGGQPVQLLDADLAPPVQLHALQAATPQDLLAQLAALARQPLAVVGGPLYRVHIASAAGLPTVVMFVIHHLIFDGRSFQPLARSLGQALQAAAGAAHEIPAEVVPSHYRAFVLNEQQMLASPEGARRLEHWRAHLQGAAATLALPADGLRTGAHGLQGQSQRQALPANLAAEVRAFAQAQGVYPANVFLTAFKLLLWRWSAQDDLTLGMPVDTRPAGDRQAAAEVGYFVDMLPIRSRWQPNAGFADCARALQVQVLDNMAHACPFPAIVRSLNLRPEAGVAPVFQVAYAYQDFANSGRAAPEAAAPAVDFVEELVQEGEFELMLEVAEHGDAFQLKWKFDPALYAPATVARMATHFQTLLAVALAAPQQRIAELPLLAAAEQQQLAAWNDTALVREPGLTLNALFERQLALAPDAPAASFEGQVLSYRELHARAEALADVLAQRGMGAGTLVGVCMDRSLELVVGLLAVLKAGAAYVPLDPAYPVERLRYMLADCAAPLVLAQAAQRPLLAELGVPALFLDEAAPAGAALPQHPARPAADPSALAYVIYTSGSTGRPKGCMLSHQAVCNRLQWMQDLYGLGAADRVLQKTPYSFDVSVWEFFWPLMAGAQLVLARPGGHKDPAYLVEIIESARITVCHFVPSMLAAFVGEVGHGRCTSLRDVFASGEALPYALYEDFAARFGARLHNLYGPTEAAVDVSYFECRPRADRRVPIGRPIHNIQLHVLDGALKPTPIGVPGELHIGGLGLARGYLNQDALTQQKFITADTGDGAPQRLYKTGDLARWLPDGEIEYLGRSDHQVKLRGFRIELGEIEAVLTRHERVREAAVVLGADAQGDKRLLAYLALHGPEPLAPSALRSFLLGELPDYMVPAVFVTLPTLPLTQSGKLDRKALPKPPGAGEGEGEGEGAGNFVAPRTPRESLLAGIWCDVLGVQRIGIRDNFFDAGGHSLKAVTLISRMAREAGITGLNQLDFFRQPTIEGVTAFADSGGLGPRDLVPLLRQGASATSLSLVCVPYAGASATVFKAFAVALCRRNPNIAVRSVSIPGNELGSDASAFDSFESLASAAVDELLDRVPGPIALYGHCVGSFLALEVARQLEQRGREVPFLVCAGAFPFPRLVKYLPVRDPWRFTSDAKLRRLIESWGGARGGQDEEALQFLLGNFRKDARHAFQYEQRRARWKLRAPLFNIVSDDDPLTRHAERRHLAWRAVSDEVSLMTIKDGGHYFVGERPLEVASLVGDIACRSARPRPAIHNPHGDRP